MQNENQWYQLRFVLREKNTNVVKKNINYLTASLLNIYINNIISEGKSLEKPFILNFFALNMKNNNFDTSLPPLLFIECTEYNDRLMTDLLKRAGVYYIGLEHINHDKIAEYRLIHDSTDNYVWSGACLTVRISSDANLLKHILEIPNYVKEKAAKLDLEIIDIVCPNIEILKHNPSYKGPIVVYIKHSPSNNDKVARLLSNQRNILQIPTDGYTYVIAKADENVVLNSISGERFKPKKIVFKPGDRVQVISGDNASLKGIVISQIDDIVSVNINIFESSIEFTFNADSLALIV